MLNEFEDDVVRCNDCDRRIAFDEIARRYRHIEEPATPCFLIRVVDEQDEAMQALEDASLVAKIRATCAREFGIDPSYDFFNANYGPGESADAALVRIFRAERDAQRRRGYQDSADDIIMVLCHG